MFQISSCFLKPSYYVKLKSCFLYPVHLNLKDRCTKIPVALWQMVHWYFCKVLNCGCVSSLRGQSGHDVVQDQLPAFLKTAERLKVKGLAEAPQSVENE